MNYTQLTKKLGINKSKKVYYDENNNVITIFYDTNLEYRASVNSYVKDNCAQVNKSQKINHIHKESYTNYGMSYYLKFKIAKKYMDKDTYRNYKIAFGNIPGIAD